MTTREQCAALGWETDLDFTVERVIACNESALIFDVVGLAALGERPTAVKVRRIDDAAVKLMRRHLPPETPVGLWYPDSLEGLERLDANHVVLTSAASLDPRALARLGPSVRTLSIYGPAFPPGSVAASSMPYVGELTLPWGLLSVDDALPPGLRSLRFEDDTPPTLSAIPRSSHLEILELSPARELATLDGLDRFPSLRTLEIAGAALHDIGGLALAPNLTVLGFEACRRLPELGPVGQLRQLRQLALLDCGDIPSIVPLAGHPSIAELVAYGTTRIADGDLSPLLSMPALRRLVLASRRSYTPSVAEVRRRAGLVGE